MNGHDDPRLTVAICAETASAGEHLSGILDGDLTVTAVVDTEEALLSLTGAPNAVVLERAGATKRAQMIRRVRNGLNGAQIVAVGAASRGHEVRSAMEAGAAGFVFEDEAHATLALTVRVACAGQIAVPRRERRQIERPTLSSREKQILGLVVMGFMNCEIAERLFLAESTVKSHLSSAFAKLGVRSRNEAVDLILDGEDGLGRGILAITGDASPARPDASSAAA